MKYETKFNFNDLVYSISHIHKEKFTECAFCKGTGKIKCNGIERCCPDCYGQKGRREWVAKQWRVEDLITIGQIRIEHTLSSNNSKNVEMAEYLEKYMCYETGVKSGTIHNGIDLFATKEDAEKECSKRNKEQDK